jgi:hypothetical protein
VKIKRILKISGIVAVSIVVLFIGLIVLAVIIDPQPATSTAQSTHTVVPAKISTRGVVPTATVRPIAPTAVPTTIPTGVVPTATVRPIAPTAVPTKVAVIPVTSNSAILGAPISSFVANYGPYNGHTDVSIGSYHWLRYADTQVVTDALIVQADNSNGEATVHDANSIDYAPEQGTTTCKQFFPQDARYEKQVPVMSGTNVYTDRIYFSASLAKVFSASAFTDENENPVKAGTFDVLNLGNNECTIQLGTQQTLSV